MPYWLILFLLNVSVSKCKTALEKFVEKKKIDNLLINTLYENRTTTWMEYTYKFTYDKTLNTSEERTEFSNLKVGVEIDRSNGFDCLVFEDEVKGYSIDVINLLRDFLNVSISVYFINKSESVSELLKNKELDIVLCHGSNDDEEVTQLYPTLESKHLLIYKPANLNFTKDIFILTFVGTLWLVFLIILILLAICLRISTTRYSIMHPRNESWSWSWVEITLWAIAAACQQGLSHTPNGFASCCIFLLGYLTAYLLYTGFAAAITSLLLQHDLYYKLDVSKLNSAELRLTCYEDSKEIVRSLSENFKHTSFTPSLEKLFQDLEKDNTVGIAPEVFLNQFMAENFKLDKLAKLRSTKLQDFRYSRGFSILGKSSWREILNTRILAMKEKGVLGNLLARNLKSLPVADLSLVYSSAGYEHVGSAMLILAAGITASVLFLLMECSFAFYKRNKAALGL